MIILLGLVMLIVSGLSVAFASGPADVTPAVVVDLSDFSPIPGSSAQLVTNDQGASIRVNTSGLPPGHAVTLWWVVLNYPENCVGICDAPDAFPPPGNVNAGASVSYAAGSVVGANGKASFAGHLPVGEDAPPWTVGLLYPRTAEFHFVLRDHGPMDPSIVSGQISTPGVGCSNIPPFTGDYLCKDIQGGIFAK
jgi:hypothetical protein